MIYSHVTQPFNVGSWRIIRAMVCNFIGHLTPTYGTNHFIGIDFPLSVFTPKRQIKILVNSAEALIMKEAIYNAIQ